MREQTNGQVNMNVCATLWTAALQIARNSGWIGGSKKFAVQRSECVPWAGALGNPFLTRMR